MKWHSSTEVVLVQHHEKAASQLCAFVVGVGGFYFYFYQTGVGWGVTIFIFKSNGSARNIANELLPR